MTETIEQVDGFISAQQLHDLLRQSGHDVGLTTVYRTVQALVEDEEVDAIRGPDGETLYRRCSTQHHHHLVCRACGYAEEVQAPSVEGWAADLARRRGFTQADHVVEVTGLCPDCSTPA